MSGVGIKLQKFTGLQPRVAPELVADLTAQTAVNTKLYSGDILPYPQLLPANGQRADFDVVSMVGMHDWLNRFHWLLFDEDTDVVVGGQSKMLHIRDFSGADYGYHSEGKVYYTAASHKPRVSSLYGMELSWLNTMIRNPSVSGSYERSYYKILDNGFGGNTYGAYYDLGIPIPPADERPTAAVWVTTNLGGEGTPFDIQREADGRVIVTMTDASIAGGGSGFIDLGAEPRFIFHTPPNKGTVIFSVPTGTLVEVGSTITINNISSPYRLNRKGEESQTTDPELITAIQGLVGTHTMTGGGVLVANVDTTGYLVEFSTASTGVDYGGWANVDMRLYVGAPAPGQEIPRATHNLRDGATIDVVSMGRLYGTYTRPSNTSFRVTISNHGLSQGDTVSLTLTLNNNDTSEGGLPSGAYTVNEVIDANTFECVIPDSPTLKSGIAILELSSLNATGVTATVIDKYTFSYYKPGFRFSRHANPQNAGRIYIGGAPVQRTYVYTYITEWGEESMPSLPSESVTTSDSSVMIIGGLPTYWTLPATRHNIVGVGVYRSIASTGNSDYYRVGIAMFPKLVTRLSRTNNLLLVQTYNQHGLLRGDWVKILGCNDATANVEARVEDIDDLYGFYITAPGSDIPFGTAAGAAATLYYNCANDLTNDIPTYYAAPSGWSYPMGYYADTTTPTMVSTILDSLDHAPPPDNMVGITAIQNDIMAGFVGNEVYFSKVSKPYAWPLENVLRFPYPVVALASTGGALVVLTKGYAYLVNGTDPSNMAYQQYDGLYPCVSKRSVAYLPAGVVYATHDGLAVISAGSAPAIATKYAFNTEKWAAALRPETLLGAVHEDTYVGIHDTGAFAFDMSRESPTFVTLSESNTATAVWRDPLDNSLYLASPASGGDISLNKWNVPDFPPQMYQWKSKVFVTDDFVNFGALRIDAAYADAGGVVWNEVDELWGIYSLEVLRLEFNDAVGSQTVTDSTGLNNASSTSGAWSIQSYTGADGNVARMTGVSYISFPNFGKPVDLPAQWDDHLCFEAVVRVDAHSGTSRVIFTNRGLGKYPDYEFAITGSGYLAFNVGQFGNYTSSPATVPTGRLVHVALALERTELNVWTGRFYIDGALVLTDSLIQGFYNNYQDHSDSQLWIGNYANSSDFPFIGYMDRVIITKHDYKYTGASTSVTRDVTEEFWSSNNDGGELSFALYVDRELKVVMPITSNRVYRLPTGYKADTFEVLVEGTARVRSIQMAETPAGLKRI